MSDVTFRMYGNLLIRIQMHTMHTVSSVNSNVHGHADGWVLDEDGGQKKL